MIFIVVIFEAWVWNGFVKSMRVEISDMSHKSKIRKNVESMRVLGQVTQVLHSNSVRQISETVLHDVNADHRT